LEFAAALETWRRRTGPSLSAREGGLTFGRYSDGEHYAINFYNIHLSFLTGKFIIGKYNQFLNVLELFDNK
jgi:hypothetical protein